MGLEYERHVSIIGIVEIVLQAFYSVVVLALVMMLILGGSFDQGSSGSTTSMSDGGNHYSNDIHGTTGVFIAAIIILVIIVAFHAWLVYLVFTGGQRKNASSLTIWYIIQSILLVLTIISQIHAIFTGNPWYSIFIMVLFIIYRVYSIHVVRSYVAELKPSHHITA